MNEHTPGPWWANIDAATGYRWVVGDPESWIPRIACCPLYSEYPVDANARLIAAAPDLLAALEKTYSLMMAGDVDREPHEEEARKIEAFLAARAAIAKAKGQ